MFEQFLQHFGPQFPYARSAEPEAQIEITSEMIEVAVQVFLSYDQNFPTPDIAVTEIFSAALGASGKRMNTRTQY